MPRTLTMLVSTYNADVALARLLESVARTDVPIGFQTEFVLVDNGSGECTKQLFESTSLGVHTSRYLKADVPGKCNAVNFALKKIESDIVVCTDEDTLVPLDWLIKHVDALDSGFDAVGGAVDIPDELRRPWMSEKHLEKLASTVGVQHSGSVMLIGANMSFRRSVLSKVPQFDPDLGPGKLGSNEDTLFSLQLHKAGFKVGFEPACSVTHMFREERLFRSTWEKVCFSQGRANAYIDYHWRHEGKPAGFTAVSKGKLGLWKRTALSRTGVEGISAQDMDFFAMLGYRHQFTKMRGAPRNYERFGLVRLDYKG